MKDLPERPHPGHLKKQAKELLAACRQRDGAALDRVRTALPVAAGFDDAAIVAMELQLHDAQSCIAREYGFASWSQLKAYVDAQSASLTDAVVLLDRWRLWTFGAGYQSARPELAARLLRDHPTLLEGKPVLACAIGDVVSVRKKIASDAAWARSPSSSTMMSPLLCACFSGLIHLPVFAQGIRDCVALLLATGADVHDTTEDPVFPGDPLGALYGAAGRNHDAPLTRMLLDAGADPNDGESLYHAAEATEPECVRLLLKAGARTAGTNALQRALDFERPQTVRLLLAHGADPSERGSVGNPLTHAIRRRRSPEVIRALLDAGADPSSCNAHGVSAYRLALRMGLTEVAELLHGAGGGIASDPREDLVAACARADHAAAGDMLAQYPDLIAALSPEQLHTLPELAAEGCDDAVRLMVEVGWPIGVRGGDIRGSALNNAVFRGNSALAAFLLAHGAHYDERHGYNDNVYGTLSFASRHAISADSDWLGCARALIESGAPVPDAHYVFADEVEAYFAALRAAN